MTGDPEKDGTESAIDADFEPAPAADYVVPKEIKPHSGPGWLLFGLMSALAAGALGLSAYNFTNAPNGAVDSGQTELSARIEALDIAQDVNAADIETLRKTAAATEERMAAEIEALLSGDEDGEGLAALVAELEAVSNRLDGAMANTGSGDALEALELRISALEEVGDASAATPGEMVSVLSSIRQRTEKLESENEAITESFADRTNAIDALKARIEDIEFAFQSIENTGDGAGSFALADLQAELENLKTTVERTEDFEEENRERFSEMLAGLEMVGEAEQKADEAKETASAALALSRIEAAAREGRSFHAAYKQLSEALPGDKAVARMESIASSGALTLRQLSQQFPGDRAAALDAMDDSADDGWGWTRQVFGSGVKVRRASAAGGPRELLDKAEEALEAGDLKAALEALQDLPEKPKAIMDDWMSRAQARLTLQDTLDDVGVRLIGRDQ